MPSYSPTRWWSKWEVMKAVMVQFGDIETFLRAQDDLAPATCSKLLGIISDLAKNACLKTELAAVVDGGECLVQATYKLEGDGPLAFCAYELVSTILASIRVSHFPNVEAIAKELCPGSPTGQQQWMTYVLQCLQPGFDYLSRIFSTTLSMLSKLLDCLIPTRYRKFSHQPRK